MRATKAQWRVLAVLTSISITGALVAACTSIRDRAFPKTPVAEFGEVPAGARWGYAEFFTAPNSGFSATYVSLFQDHRWNVPSSEWVSGSHGQAKNYRTPDNRVQSWRVRLKALVGIRQFQLNPAAISGQYQYIKVPIEEGKITPVEIEWTVLSRQQSGFGDTLTYRFDAKVGSPGAYIDPTEAAAQLFGVQRTPSDPTPPPSVDR